MTPDRWKRIEELAEAALERNVGERIAFLDVECVHEPDLRRQVERFLRAFDQIATQDETRVFLGRQIDSVDLPQIRHYRLLREIGHGGMGSVYLAARSDEEFQRFVAVKLLRPGPGSRGLMRRFRSERQILANLDHPNIAKLLDGGTTDSGLPYLVIELIEGNRIDQYCDDHRLDIRQRIDLFREVCAAVQYAHRNLVVHRDIKPSNILVTAEGAPKLLDFGIAKLLDPTDFPYTVEATRTGLRPMTPPYASPEQVRGEAITTASDIYSLGVLLYKLLTGRLPLATAGLSPQQVEKILIESTPFKPSAAVVKSALEEDTTLSPATISRLRATPTRQLSHQLAGDLDTIVLMALRKEPERRYGSVEQFSEDLRRHLAGRPVAARSDTFAYRAEKFLQRNKIAAGIAGTSFVLLTAFAASMARQAVQLARQRDRALKERDRAEQVSTFLADVFSIVDPDEIKGATITVIEVLEQGEKKIRQALADQPDVQASLLHVLGTIYRKSGFYDHAEGLLREALEARELLLGDVEVAESLNELALLNQHKGSYGQSMSLFLRALEIRVHRLGPSHQGVAEILINLATICIYRGEHETAESFSQKSLRILECKSDPNTALLARALSISSVLSRLQSRFDRAETLQKRAIRLMESGGQVTHHAAAISNLGSVYLAQHQIRSAERLFHRAHSMLVQAVGSDHHDVASLIANLGSCHSLKGDYERAKTLYQQALDTLETAINPDHRNVPILLCKIGSIYRRTGQYDHASSFLDRALRILSKDPEKEDEHVATAIYQSASCSAEQSHYTRAERQYRRAAETQKRASGPTSASLFSTLNALAELYARQGKIEEAHALYHQSFDVSKEMARRQPTNLRPQNNQAFAGMGLGDLHRSSGDERAARRFWLQALELIENMPLKSELVESRDIHCRTLFRLSRIDEAQPIAEGLLEIGWANPDFLACCRQHGLIAPDREPEAGESNSPTS